MKEIISETNEYDDYDYDVDISMDFNSDEIKHIEEQIGHNIESKEELYLCIKYLLDLGN